MAMDLANLEVGEVEGVESCCRSCLELVVMGVVLNAARMVIEVGGGFVVGVGEVVVVLLEEQEEEEAGMGGMFGTTRSLYPALVTLVMVVMYC